MRLYIKNMVSLRCKLAVESIITKLRLHPRKIELGEIEIAESLSQAQRRLLGQKLRELGLELLYDKKGILVEKIKNMVIRTIHEPDELSKINYRDYLSKRLKHNYTYLSNLFSHYTGCTLEHFIITHKIERVKKLLAYDELNLTEISFKMNYSSVAHLSSQFKKITGLTPTDFRNHSRKQLNALDNL